MIRTRQVVSCLLIFLGLTSVSVHADEADGSQWKHLLDSELSQWEVFTRGETSVFVVNGTSNMVLERTEHHTPDGWKPLTKGKLQIQSEAAEVYYRDIKIRPLARFPDSLESITQPFEGKVEWFN